MVFYYQTGLIANTANMGHEAVVGHGDDWLPGSHGPFKGPFKFLCLVLFFFFFFRVSLQNTICL